MEICWALFSSPPNRFKHQFYFSLPYKPYLLIWTKILNLARKKMTSAIACNINTHFDKQLLT